MKLRLTAILLFSMCLSSFAQQKGLHLIDRAVTFEGNSRKEVTKFLNQGTDTLKFSLSIVPRWMNDSGRIVEDGDTSLLHEAAPYLRIYPRVVTVPPNALQSVAVQLRRDAEMEPGEYRSHLLFTPIIEENDITEQLGSDTSTSTDEVVTDEVSTQIKIYTASSIPVMIMVDSLIEAASIENLHFSDRGIDLEIDRSASNRSLRSFIKTTYIAPDGTETEYQNVPAIIYREVDRLPFTLPFSELPSEGHFKIQVVVYDSNTDMTVLDTKEITVNP